VPAAAHAALSDYDAADDAGNRALNTPRPTDAITRRARSLAHERISKADVSSAARDFAERLIAL
jgi:hypothetical protein